MLWICRQKILAQGISGAPVISSSHWILAQGISGARTTRWILAQGISGARTTIVITRF